MAAWEGDEYSVTRVEWRRIWEGHEGIGSLGMPLGEPRQASRLREEWRTMRRMRGDIVGGVEGGQSGASGREGEDGEWSPCPGGGNLGASWAVPCACLRQRGARGPGP